VNRFHSGSVDLVYHGELVEPLLKGLWGVLSANTKWREKDCKE
jgi:hypothetical protein